LSKCWKETLIPPAWTCEKKKRNEELKNNETDDDFDLIQIRNLSKIAQTASELLIGQTGKLMKNEGGPLTRLQLAGRQDCSQRWQINSK